MAAELMPMPMSEVRMSSIEPAATPPPELTWPQGCRQGPAAQQQEHEGGPQEVQQAAGASAGRKGGGGIGHCWRCPPKGKALLGEECGHDTKGDAQATKQPTGDAPAAAAAAYSAACGAADAAATATIAGTRLHALMRQVMTIAGGHGPRCDQGV